MNDAYQAFLEEPTLRNYCRVRRIITASPSFDRSSLELHRLASLYREGRFKQLLEEAWRIADMWLLSPRFHFLSGVAADQLGDEDEAELERFQFHTCLDALLASGDGSAESPYMVQRACDEYDVLEALGRTSKRQQVLQRDGLWLDVINCDDGTQLWFDLGRAAELKPTKRRVLPRNDQIHSPAGRRA